MSGGQVAHVYVTEGEDGDNDNFILKTFTGRYVVYYDGAGSISYAGGCTKVADLSANGRHVVDYNGAAGLFTYKVLSTPIKRVRIYPIDLDPGPGKEPPSYFHPRFIERLRGYSVIRFMDWMRTNYSDGPGATFADRAKLTDVRWSTNKGVPIEAMCALCNELNCEAWFTIHHLASDDWIYQGFAPLVDSKLAKNLAYWIEHSNETWNGIFPQTSYCTAQGASIAPDFEGNRKFHSRRTKRIIDLVRQASSETRKIAGVLGAWDLNASNTTVMLAFEDCHMSVDAVAIGAYFGDNLGLSDATNVALVGAMNVNTLLRYCTCQAIPAMAAKVRGQYMACKPYGIPLVMYEGGQHLTGVGARKEVASLNKLFDAANRAEGMYNVYHAWGRQWKVSGGTLMVHFTDATPYTKHGRYGAVEYSNQTISRNTAPKAEALRQWSAANKRWWAPIARTKSQAGF